MATTTMTSKCTLTLLVLGLVGLGRRLPGVEGGVPGFNCPIAPLLPTLQPCELDCTTQHGGYNGVCVDNFNCFCNGSGLALALQPCVYFEPEIRAKGLCHCADQAYADSVYDGACKLDCTCNHGTNSSTCNYETHQCICNYHDNTPDTNLNCPIVAAAFNATKYILDCFTLNP